MTSPGLCYVLSHSVMSNSLWPHGLWPARLLSPGRFSRQEHCSGMMFPGDLPSPGIEPMSPALQANSLPSEPPGLTWFKMILKVFYNAFLKSYNTLFSPPVGSLEILSDRQNVQLFVTPWTVVHQAPLSVEFFTQEYWSGLPFTSLGDLLDSGLLHCRWILYWVSH